MTDVLNLMIRSGETGINLTLYTLLPIMVIMMALMRTLEDRGLLQRFAVLVSPVLILFGLPGLGVFAILQILLINFAAPIATLKIMEHDENITDSMRSATLAAILVMSQANATFPLAVVGLNIPVVLMSSLLGGLLSGFIAYRLTGAERDVSATYQGHSLNRSKRSLIQSMFAGGEEGLQIVVKSIVPLILAVFLVNIFRETGVITLMERLLSPLLTQIGIPGIAVLPMVTKYLAGGTSMMAVTLELIQEGGLTPLELNRMAGMTINTLDPVGLALLLSAGPKTVSVAKPAIQAALVGILFRAVLHLILF